MVTHLLSQTFDSPPDIQRVFVFTQLPQAGGQFFGLIGQVVNGQEWISSDLAFRPGSPFVWHKL
jgi:hypothetical protein